VTAPLVAIVMGSKTDMPVMEKAATALDEFDVPHFVEVMSAHRDPKRVAAFAEGAVEAGLKVIIAGAGRAAHLPGVVASLTPLPVIGVPCLSDHLGGADSLFSIVQMPPGVPVATVGIDAARNAGLLAVQILGTADADLRARFEQFKVDLTGGGVAGAKPVGFQPR